MNFTTEQIEAITQGVLLQLRSRGIVVSGGIGAERVGSRNARLSSGANTNGEPTTAKADQPVVVGSVVTEDMLSAAGIGGGTIQIDAGAVITPSGHDYIRRHQIAVVSSSVGVSNTAPGLLLFMGNLPAATSAASTANWQTIDVGCEREAAAKARKELPAPVVCCVDEPSIAACLLNRDQSIRAAVITDATDLTHLVSSMNPHVVCINAVGWSFASFLRLLKQMTTHTAAPSSWKELS